MLPTPVVFPPLPSSFTIPALAIPPPTQVPHLRSKFVAPSSFSAVPLSSSSIACLSSSSSDSSASPPLRSFVSAPILSSPLLGVSLNNARLSSSCPAGHSAPSSSISSQSCHGGSFTSSGLPPPLAPLTPLGSPRTGVFDVDGGFVHQVFEEVTSLAPTSASDIFPLPLLPRRSSSSASPSRSRRVTKRASSSMLHIIVFNHLVSALNSLYASFFSPSSYPGARSIGTSSLTPSSSTVGTALVRRVTTLLHSSVSTFLHRRGALPISGGAATLDDFLPVPVFDSYLSSPPVVPLSADRISLPSSPHPVPLLSLLPSHIAVQYSSPSLLLSDPPPLSPVQRATKPVLCEQGEWSRFVRRLKDHGMVTFMANPRVVNSVFCLAKPDRQQRFIINAIKSNLFFSTPPNPHLPTPDMVSSLLPAPSDRGKSTLYAAKVDLECFYFFISLPEWLVPFFGMPAVRAADMSTDLALQFGADTMVFPCFNRLPMGWNHSVFLAQEAHLHLLLSRGVLRDLDRICKQNDLRLDRVRWFVYIDDFCVIGFDPVLVRRVQDAYLAAVRSLGFVVKLSKLVLPTSSPVQLLGLDFDGSALSYGLGADKLEALCMDTRRFISSASASGHQLSSLVGRWSWAMLVRRPLFAVLSSVFGFIQRAGSSVFSVWSSVRRELSVLLGLAPLLRVSIASSVFPVAVAVDASLSAAGVVAIKSSSPTLSSLAAVNCFGSTGFACS